jgi:hypothetical protein
MAPPPEGILLSLCPPNPLQIGRTQRKTGLKTAKKVKILLFRPLRIKKMIVEGSARAEPGSWLVNRGSRAVPGTVMGGVIST